ncbi:MAG: response regulator [Candidatus Lokiarchaeota archaeon]|nr:response regulator [Candidatus Lokiarchaeota archaeon]
MMTKETPKMTPRDRDEAVVGKLTAGVLHEFRNLLQGIIGLAEMLETDEALPEKSKIGIKAIRRLGQNATSLIQDFGVPGKPRPSAPREKEDIDAAESLGEKEPPEEERLAVLVAEDDPMVLNVVTGMLKHLGYTTLEAKNGEEAFELYNENINRIGMVISDMVMPKMGGMDLAEEILSKNPDEKVVVMTGYLREDLEIDPDDFGLAGWLEKPMTAERLKQLVQSIMG